MRTTTARTVVLEATLAVLVVVVLVFYAAAMQRLADHDAQRERSHDEEPMQRLSGYDLESAVRALMEEIDGCAPAPAIYTSTGTPPTMVTLSPDRRTQHGVVVSLEMEFAGASGDSSEWAVNIVRGSEGLSEGNAVAAAVLDPTGAEPTLLAPIRLSPQTPLKLEVTALPGVTPGAATITARMSVLYGSAEAVDYAIEQLGGQARWWGFFAQAGGTEETVPLTVERGGRPTYVRAANSGNAWSADLTLDGRRMTVPAVELVQAGILGRSYLSHEVEAGQIYSAVLETGGAGASRSYWVWHGPARY